MTAVILTRIATDEKPSEAQKHRAGSLAARAALGALYSHITNRRMPEVLSDGNGKPYVCENNAFISISHTDSFAAAVLSDEGEVGIDIEGECDPDKAGRIEARYLKNVNLDLLSVGNNVELFWLKTDKNGSPCEIIPLADAAKIACLSDTAEVGGARFEQRWTLLEAVLKADGRGFGAYPEINTIATHCYATAYELEINGKRLYLSVAVKK